MALPPTIPTSFVPRAEVAQHRGGRLDFAGAMRFVAYGIFILALVGAAGVFAYERYLLAEKTSQDAALAKAESAIDPATVQSFLELRDRLAGGESLLNKHVVFSSFFDVLQQLSPSSVRFAALTLTTDDTRAASATLTGTAASFNALAAASASFASDARIKNAIFSNLAINKDGTVGFSLTATLDPSLVELPPSTSSGQAATPTP